MVSLDGYFEGPNHDLSWHNVDEEFNQFAINQLHDTGMMLFGRRTYQLIYGGAFEFQLRLESHPERYRIPQGMSLQLSLFHFRDILETGASGVDCAFQDFEGKDLISLGKRCVANNVDEHHCG
jgi:hypothetical protein